MACRVGSGGFTHGRPMPRGYRKVRRVGVCTPVNWIKGDKCPFMILFYTKRVWYSRGKYTSGSVELSLATPGKLG